MATWAELATDSLHLLSVISLGESPDAVTLGYCLRKCERMLHSWAADQFLIPGYQRLAHTFEDGGRVDQVLVLGSEGAPQRVVDGFDDEEDRPLILVSDDHPSRIGIVQYLRAGDTQAYPLGELGLSAYMDPRNLSRTTFAIPSKFYYEYQEDRGLLFLNSLPSSGDTLILTYQTEIPGTRPTVNDGAASTGLPSGFESTIEYNLAVEISSRFDKPDADMRDIRRQARTKKNMLQNKQAPRIEMRVSPSFRSRGTRMTGGGIRGRF